MFGINKVVKDTSCMIDYYEIRDLLFSVVTDGSNFDKKISNFNNDMQDKIQNSALYLYYKEDKTINEIKFINKYNEYILKNINSDIKNVLNNKYCFNILSKEISNCNSDEDIIKIFDMSFKNLFDKLDRELDKIYNKFLNGIELSIDEKKFYENNILFTVKNQIIFNEDNEEILK